MVKTPIKHLQTIIQIQQRRNKNSELVKDQKYLHLDRQIALNVMRSGINSKVSLINLKIV